MRTVTESALANETGTQVTSNHKKRTKGQNVYLPDDATDEELLELAAEQRLARKDSEKECVLTAGI